ncbi:MAG TPA: nucleotidyltransferase domain-containing protein, partial [Anaerolineae bacterium]|nr:nucleotidyltransferase domain-containing protein [Anaerolineae bacterium]
MEVASGDPGRVAERSQRLREALAALDEVRFAYLHGSAAEGLAYRDLDVALYLDPAHPAAGDSFDYEMDLSVDLTRRLTFPVDVRVLNRAPLGFQQAVTTGVILVVRDEEELFGYIERVAMERMD